MMMIWLEKKAGFMEEGGYGLVGIRHIESEMVLMSLSKLSMTSWTAEISGLVPSVCI